MKASLCSIVVYVLVLPLLFSPSQTSPALRPQVPVIGVISTPSDFANLYNPSEYSFIKETYPNFIRQAGGEPIFIPHNLPDAELLPLLERVNGVVLVGGNARYWDEDLKTGRRIFTDYVRQIQKIIGYAYHSNNQSIYLPLMGICEGMEVSLMSLTNDPYLLDSYSNFDNHTPFKITEHGGQSRMFGQMSSEQAQFLSESGSLFFNHQFGYNLSSLNKYRDLENSFRITAIAEDENNEEFIAAMEGKDWPIYLVMFHPERTAWEKETDRYSHHDHVVDFSEKLAKFFVEESRKSSKRFDSRNDWSKWDFRRYEPITIEEDKPRVYIARRETLLNSKEE